MLTKRKKQHYFAQFYHERKAGIKDKYGAADVWEDADNINTTDPVEIDSKISLGRPIWG